MRYIKAAGTNGLHYTGPILLLLGLMFISAPYFSNAAQWIFINADEAKYSFGAHQFLRTGSWGYSGRKPGAALIVAAAQLIMGETPTSALYATGIVGMLMVLVLYKMSRIYLPMPLAVVGSLTMASSMLFQYYTKTHIVFSSFLFMLGVMFYLQSLSGTNQSRQLFFSGLSMGAGLSCYYNLEIYIPVLLLSELALWRQTGRLDFRTRGASFLVGAALIPLLLDTYAAAHWTTLKRFSEPVTMSLIDHIKLTNVAGFSYPWDRFTSVLVDSEGTILCVLFVSGLATLFWRVIRCFAAKDIVLLTLMCPLLLLLVRAWLGHLSVLRTFFSGFPFIVLVALIPLSVVWNFISTRLPNIHAGSILGVLTSLGLVWCGWRAHATYENISRISTGYQHIEQFLQQIEYQRVAYWGNQFAWRYYLRDRESLELQTEGQPDILRLGGTMLKKHIESYQWVVINQARSSDLVWIEENLSEAGFALHRSFGSNEFDFSLVRQEEFADDYASYDASKDIRIYESQQ